MTDEIKIITEGQAKDLILEYALKNGDKTISAHEIQKEILPELSSDEVEFLFEKIQNTTDNVADVAISEYACLITATGITKRFIEQGGFTKSEKETAELKEKKAEKERIDFEKSIIDLRLKKWQLKTFWWIFGFAIIGSALSVYNFTNSLSPSKNVKQQEERIEKMESELEKLQTSISNGKTLDSLQTTKDLTEIEKK
ncbi:hypothetical protein [Bizionia paragorgiae]|uniref:Uncharacterized protein n=1 Tax=Bizionia paragorgiae TaxID=283786 RepID=A0A1H4CJZ9_BIZPA|nr:hypothetical protein [Bizionia paragorgiae]SEA60687.1 hypothetical protein SAMN04487990_12031 [Bizionia paragorgiae]